MTCCVVEGMEKCGFVSEGTLKEIIYDNHGHRLFKDGTQFSDFWYVRDEWKCCDITAIPLAYIMGSIGYALSVVRKVILLAVNILNTFNPCSDRTLSDRGIILLDTFLALSMAIIGCACSPLAYQLDRVARNAMLDLAEVETTEDERNSFLTPKNV